MSENIEKAVPTEESPKTKESETSALAATDNVVLYPVADISAAQETTDTETAASKEITDPQNTDDQTTIDSKTTDGKAADNGIPCRCDRHDRCWRRIQWRSAGSPV